MRVATEFTASEVEVLTGQSEELQVATVAEAVRGDRPVGRSPGTQG